MDGDRLRVPIDEPYLVAVGLATICFARLEWNAVWCCEKIQAGYISTIEPKRKTAGIIAKDLIALANGHSDPSIASSLGTAAAEFARLVVRRNALIHAKPGTAPNGGQRLFHQGSIWTIPMIEELSDEFVAASGPLNHHIHHQLS